MTSKDNLYRILQSNRAKKVKQLSEIASLFEKEQRVSKQIKEVERFKESVSTDLELNEESRKTLPRNFLHQEDDKRTEILGAAISFQLVAESQANEIRRRQDEEREKLARVDNIIDRIDKEVRRQVSIEDQIQEIIESEEIQQNV